MAAGLPFRGGGVVSGGARRVLIDLVVACGGWPVIRVGFAVASIRSRCALALSMKTRRRGEVVRAKARQKKTQAGP